MRRAAVDQPVWASPSPPDRRSRIGAPRDAFVVALALLGACRGQPSEKQPIHLIGDMDWQPKIQPERASALWPDGRGMRPLVPGTIPQGELREDDGTYRGMVGAKYLARVPIKIDAAAMLRGQERFNIYCAPCHDRTGGGRGMTVQKGYPQPVYLPDRVKVLPDGRLFWTITNGIRNMPSYAKQIPVEDRWKIVAWLRVLSRSQSTTLADVPPDQREQILPETPPK